MSFLSRTALSAAFAVFAVSSLSAGLVACSSHDDGGGAPQEDAGAANADADAAAEASAHDSGTAPDASDGSTVTDSSTWHDPNDGSWNPDALPQSN